MAKVKPAPVAPVATEDAPVIPVAPVAPVAPVIPDNDQNVGDGDGDELEEIAEALGNVDPNAKSADGTAQLWDGKVLPPTEWAEYLALSKARSLISKIAPEHRTDDQNATVRAFSKAYNAYDKALTKARKAGLVAPAKSRAGIAGSGKPSTGKIVASALAEYRATTEAINVARLYILPSYDQGIDCADLALALIGERYAASITIPVDEHGKPIVIAGKAPKIDPVATVQKMATNDILTALSPAKRAEMLALLTAMDASEIAAK